MELKSNDLKTALILTCLKKNSIHILRTLTQGGSEGLAQWFVQMLDFQAQVQWVLTPLPHVLHSPPSAAALAFSTAAPGV